MVYVSDREIQLLSVTAWFELTLIRYDVDGAWCPVNTYRRAFRSD